jgi:hypothetical protein
MERIANRSIGNVQEKTSNTRINSGKTHPIGTNVPFGTGFAPQAVDTK